MKLHTPLPRVGCAALCLTLAAALACGCTPQSEPASSAVSAANGNTGETQVPLYDASRLNDDTLRLLYGTSDALGSTILRGSEVLCTATPSENLYLITDTAGQANYYLHTWNDSSASGGRRSAVYNKLGKELLSLEGEARAWLVGQYLMVCTDPDAAFNGIFPCTPGYLRVFDLSTQGDGSIRGEIPVPENAVNCAPAGDYFVFTVYDQPEGITDPYEDTSCYAHCSVQVQDASGNVLFTQSGCQASSLYGEGSASLTNWVSLSWYEENSYVSSRTALYCPADGRMLDGFEETCGGTMACFTLENGKHALRDLNGTYYAEVDRTVEYYLPGIVISWDTDTACYQLYELSTGEVTPLTCYDYGSGSNYLAVFTKDGTLRVYDKTTGETVLDLLTTLDPSSENGYSLSIIGSRYLCLQPYSGSKVMVYAIDGSGYYADLTSLAANYNYFSPLTATDEAAYTGRGLLFEGTYDGPGGTSLTDVVDCEGNVVLHGLGYAYSDSSLPDGCFVARRGYYYGWMDTDGNWLYCNSIFASLIAEDGTSYIYG